MGRVLDAAVDAVLVSGGARPREGHGLRTLSVRDRQSALLFDLAIDARPSAVRRRGPRGAGREEASGGASAALAQRSEGGAPARILRSMAGHRQAKLVRSGC